VAKTVKFEGVFEVKGADGSVEARSVIKDESTQEEATQHFPWKIAGGQTAVQISMGGVALAKKLTLRVDQEVTLRLSEVTDTGFKFGPGDLTLSSATGISGIWLDTGPSETKVSAIITGD